MEAGKILRHYLVDTLKNLVTEVAEKQVISEDATVGIFTFRHGYDFIEAAEHMIANNERTNNEFYISPCYNHMIAKGKRIGIYDIGSEGNGMYGLGIPEDLDLFLSNPISERVRR